MNYLKHNLKKCKVEIIPFPQYNLKNWVKVTFPNSFEWVPSFEELGIISRFIGLCESDKYQHGLGKTMVSNFIWECVQNPERDIKEILKRYQVPER